MANELLINHNFVSAKPDSPDSTIVSAGEWNDVLEVSGGVTGDMILRDVASATGARLVHGPAVGSVGGVYSGASPSGALAPFLVTLSTAGSVILASNVAAVTSTGAVCTASIRRNGVVIGTFSVAGTGVLSTNVTVFAEPAGTYTYDVVLSIGGGATFTSSTVGNVGLLIGRL